MREANLYLGCAVDAEMMGHDDFVLLSSRVMAQQLSAAGNAYACGPPEWYRSDSATQGAQRNKAGRWRIAAQPVVVTTINPTSEPRERREGGES